MWEGWPCGLSFRLSLNISKTVSFGMWEG